MDHWLSLIQTLAIVIGGLWIIYQFVLKREAHPKIEFQLDAKPLGRQKGRLLVEVSATMKNVGNVRHIAPDFTLDLRYLKDSDDVRSGDVKINFQTIFPNTGTDAEKFVKFRPFVEPGVCQVFTYIADVPANATFLLIRSRFEYESRIAHSAQRAIFVGEPQ